MAVVIVSATRLTEKRFWLEAPLAIHLARIKRDPRLRISVSYENDRGLPEVYNRAIAAATMTDILCFVHDDVWIEDLFFVDRLMLGLQQFDLLGVAGARVRRPFQRVWSHSPQDKSLDRGNISGLIGQGDRPFGEIAYFGPSPMPCALLDGVLLATKKDRLKHMRFDEQFRFHFYDLDFCRAAGRAGLKIGTWPLSITHRSEGDYDSEAWIEAGKTYLKKWGD